MNLLELKGGQVQKMHLWELKKKKLFLHITNNTQTAKLSTVLPHSVRKMYPVQKYKKTQLRGCENELLVEDSVPV